MAVIGRVFSELWQLLGSQRKLWLPFLLTAIAESVLIGLLWLAPHPPFSSLLAPPIRYFSGDQVLHYPWHLWFLYHAMQHVHLVVVTFIGAYLTGVACVMVRQRYEGESVVLRNALVSRQVSYGRMVLLWFILWAGYGGMGAMFGWLWPHSTGHRIVIITAIALVVQALFAYMIPAAVFLHLAWWRAVIAGIRETLRYPWSTLLVVAVPTAILMVFARLASEQRVAEMMVRTAPEIAIVFVLARLLVWTVADTMLTIGICHLWCLHHAAAKLQQPASVTAATRTRVKLVPGKGHVVA